MTNNNTDTYLVRDAVSHREVKFDGFCVQRGRTLRESNEKVYVTSSGKKIPCRKVWCCNLCSNTSNEPVKLIHVSERDFSELRKAKVVL